MRRPTTWLVLALMAALVAATFLSPADAKTRSLHDPNDTSGRFDVRRISSSSDGRFIDHRIVTYERWPTKFLRHSRTEFSLWFDRNSNGKIDHVCYIYYRDGKLQASWNTYSGGSDYAGIGYVTNLDVDRADRRSVDVQIGKRRLRDSYQWYVTSSFKNKSGPCKKRACQDRAPDTDWLTY